MMRDRLKGDTHKTAILHVRLREERADLLRLIADSETAGNMSALVRGLVDQKIDSRLRSVRRPTPTRNENDVEPRRRTAALHR